MLIISYSVGKGTSIVFLIPKFTQYAMGYKLEKDLLASFVYNINTAI